MMLYAVTPRSNLPSYKHYSSDESSFSPLTAQPSVPLPASRAAEAGERRACHLEACREMLEL